MLKAGTSKIDISPQKGIELAGYPHFPRYNIGIHDPLYASCLYLCNEEKQILIITLDLLFFSRKYVKEVRHEIKKITSIPENNIFISATHTHSGPWAAGRLDMEALEKGLGVDDEYIIELKNKLILVTLKAYSDTFPASIGAGYAICGEEKNIGGNRRDLKGPVDPRLWVIAVKDNNNDLRASIIKYALHPTILHEDNTLVSADYPGYIREYFRKKRPNMDLLFMQGTSGDQSTRYFRKGQNFDESKRIGFTIGQTAYEIIKRIDYEKEVNLDVQSMNIYLPIKEFPTENEAEAFSNKAKTEWKKLKRGGVSYLEVQNANLRNLGAENILGYVRLKNKGIPILLELDELPTEVMVIVIGDIRIVGLPGEIFVKFGLDIQKESQFEKTIVVELANGCLPGYVCTGEAIREGSYEAGTSMLSEKSGKILVENVLEILKRTSK